MATRLEPKPLFALRHSANRYRKSNSKCCAQPPRARVGRVMRDATHAVSEPKRPKLYGKRVPGGSGHAQSWRKRGRRACGLRAESVTLRGFWRIRRRHPRYCMQVYVTKCHFTRVLAHPEAPSSILYANFREELSLYEGSGAPGGAILDTVCKFTRRSVTLRGFRRM